MICRKCGEEMPDKAKACWRCGYVFTEEERASSMGETKTCERCGEKLPAIAKACWRCGMVFEAAAPKAEPPKPRICAVCGSELPAGAISCPKCETLAEQGPRREFKATFDAEKQRPRIAPNQAPRAAAPDLGEYYEEALIDEPEPPADYIDELPEGTAYAGVETAEEPVVRTEPAKKHRVHPVLIALLAVVVLGAAVFGIVKLVKKAKPKPETGSIGNNVTYSLYKGTLTISGSGETANYSDSEAPFSNKGGIEKVVIDEGVTRLGQYLFYNCKSIKEVQLPESLEEIDVCSFGHCTALESIEIPTGVTRIDNRAFYNCENLSNVQLDNKLEYIGGAAFFNCKKLEHITVPASVTHIFVGAFADSGLKTVHLKDGLEYIDKGAFERCKYLESITIPKGVTSIEDDVFNSCKSLTDITIPDSVTEIAINVFEGCSKVTIHCHSGSAAEAYAKENDINYQLID
ncbi:MAG: leucine-rich repeat protein [Ruminococcus sp.]|nr:leucine-rich repeat protein [Ruminococcus sp.]